LNAFFDSAGGTPLELGPGNCSATSCAWFVEAWGLSSDLARLDYIYGAGLLSQLPALLDSTASDTIIASLDLERGPGLYAVSRVVTSQAGGYHLTQQLVSLASLDSAAAAEGAAKRVITAVSFDSGQVLFLSYAWDHDSAAGYDTRVATASLTTAAAVADSLAQGGYVITAVGGDTASGYVVVGTKIHGATAPRHILVNPPAGTDLSVWVPVAYLKLLDGTPIHIWEQ
jgi:hypothetical protein